MSTSTPSITPSVAPRPAARIFGLVFAVAVVILFAVMWVGIAQAYATGGGILVDVWTWLTSLPLIVAIVAWILLLPLAVAAWAWSADLAGPVMAALVVGLVAWTVLGVAGLVRELRKR